MSKKKAVTFPRNDSPNELTGHSSRVCAVKYIPGGHGNTLVSGAWDNTLQFWDARKGHRSTGTIVGPQVASNFALDICDNKLLVGSFRKNDQVQIYDIRTRTLLQDLANSGMPAAVVRTGKDSDSDAASTWESTSSADSAGGSGVNGPPEVFPMLPPGLQAYTAQFSCNGKYVAVGGSNCDGSKGFLRVLNTLDMSWQGTGCKCAVFGHKTENLLAAVGTEGKLAMFEL